MKTCRRGVQTKEAKIGMCDGKHLHERAGPVGNVAIVAPHRNGLLSHTLHAFQLTYVCA